MTNLYLGEPGDYPDPSPEQLAQNKILGSITLTRESLVNPRPGVFASMMADEIDAYSKDAREWGWKVWEEDYWKSFSRWPWWRQALELLQRPTRRWRYRLSSLRKEWRCWLLKQHDTDPDDSPYRDAYCHRCAAKTRGPIE